MSDAVQQLDAILNETGQPQSPLRPHQVEEYERELSRLGAMHEGRDAEGRPMRGLMGTGAQAHKIRQIRETLHQQAPRPIDDAVKKDRVHRLTTEIIDDVIRPAMLPQEVMRRNPAGAVDAFMKRENSRPIKRAILTVKRALFALEPTTTDTDHANLEKFRPTQMQGGVSTFMADAQIPGMFAFSAKAKENWPLEPPKNTAVEQARLADQKRKQRTSELGPTTEARRAWGQKMAALRAAKKAAKVSGGAGEASDAAGG